MNKQISLTEARGSFSDIINEVLYQGNSFVISKQGKAAAALVPVEVLDAYLEERQRKFDILRRLQEKNTDNDPDELMKAVLEGQQAVRAQNQREEIASP